MSDDGITRRTAIVLTGAAVAAAALPGQIGRAGAVESGQAALTEGKRVGVFGIILDATTTHYSVTRDELFSEDRSARVVRPRQVAMYLAFHFSGRSLPEIGRRIGGRDHTTVLHACRKMEGLRQSDPGAAADINQIIVRCMRAMRANGIPLDRESYTHARWFLKVKTTSVPPWRAERYGQAFLRRETPWLA